MTDRSFARAVVRWGQRKAQETRHHHPEILAIAGYFRGTLRVEGISLRDGGVSALDDLLRSHGMNASIRKLDLIRCDLGGTVEDAVDPVPIDDAAVPSDTVHALVRLIQSTPNLRSIDLSCNFIDNASFQLVVDALSMHRGLEELVFQDNRLNGRPGGRLIRTLLQQHPRLTSLDIYENAISAAGVEEMIPTMNKHGKLVKLNVACCDIHQEDDSEKESIYQVLVDSLLKNPSLKELQWSVGQIVVHGETALPSPSESGTLALARLLEDHPSLESLSVIQSPDFWGPEESQQETNRRMARALGENRTLQRFTLEGCGICDDAVASLCDDVLMRNPVLQHLDLLSNDLGDEGHGHIHRVLPELKHLRSLSLEGSTLEKPEDFVAAMEHNTSLTYVRVLDTPRIDISAAVDDFAVRNELMLNSRDLLRTSFQNGEEDTVSDAVWGRTLARLAQDARGASAVYQVLTRKLWVPAAARSQRDRPPLRKRRRLS